MWPAGTGKTLPSQPPLEVENIVTEQPEQPPKVTHKVEVCEKEVSRVKGGGEQCAVNEISIMFTLVQTPEFMYERFL